MSSYQATPLRVKHCFNLLCLPFLRYLSHMKNLVHMSRLPFPQVSSEICPTIGGSQLGAAVIAVIALRSTYHWPLFRFPFVASVPLW
jgi:hypothetical protein